MENVILCLSLFAFGLRMFMALLRLELEKCLMNVASTLSISLETCNGKWLIILQEKAQDEVLYVTKIILKKNFPFY